MIANIRQLFLKSINIVFLYIGFSTVLKNLNIKNKKNTTKSEESRKASFVNKERLKVVKSREEFIKIKDNCNRHLECLDLSNIDISNIDLHDFKLEDVVFNYFDVEKKQRKEIFNVNFMGCVMERVAFAQCLISRCNFDSYKVTQKDMNNIIIETEHTTSLTDCDFFFSEFVNCRFIKTQIRVADFRYSSLTDCSMGFSKVEYGDFYMTSFRGATNFSHSKFKLCSITNATFDNHCLLMENIDRLVQEDYDSYKDYVINKEKWTKHNPCATFSVMNEAEKDELGIKIYIADEAALVYTMLSGIYSSKGLYSDSNTAYARAKDNEIRYWKLNREKDWRDKCYWRYIKDFVKVCRPLVIKRLGYGFRMKPVVIAMVVVILVSWLILWIFEKDTNWAKSLDHSICNFLTPNFNNINGIPQSVICIEPAFGILLVGFFGFVLANKIRHNSWNIENKR